MEKYGPTHKCLEAPGQIIIQVGSQPHPSANRLPKVPPGTQLPRISPTWSPTHQRNKNQLQLPVGRHQSLSSGSLQQAPVSISATRGGGGHQKQERLQLLSAKREPHQKSIQNEKAEKYDSDKGGRKKPRKIS